MPKDNVCEACKGKGTVRLPPHIAGRYPYAKCSVCHATGHMCGIGEDGVTSQEPEPEYQCLYCDSTNWEWNGRQWMCVNCGAHGPQDGGASGSSAKAEQLAKEFHETYEKLAPKWGWRSQTPVDWADVPIENRELMIDVMRIFAMPYIARREAAAYERGRVAEAKTCEEAGRHDTRKAIIDSYEYLLEKASVSDALGQLDVPWFISHIRDDIELLKAAQHGLKDGER